MIKSIELAKICPILGLQANINIDYVRRVYGGFDKQRFSCGLIKSGYTCKSVHKCPLYNDAPKIVN